MKLVGNSFQTGLQNPEPLQYLGSQWHISVKEEVDNLLISSVYMNLPSFMQILFNLWTIVPEANT